MREYYYNQDDVPLIVEYSFEVGAPATYDYPPEGSILSIHRVYLEGDNSKTDLSTILSKEVQTRIEDEVLEYEENHSYEDVYEDFSDART